MAIPQEPMPHASAGTFRLSKSKYLSGLQCQKRLYLEIHAPTLATAPDEKTQAILDMGTEVGELARQRFPGGVLVTATHRHPTEALRQTAALLADPAVPAIYEGALECDRVLVRVDILERVAPASGGPDKWRLIEVKSSSRTKDVHISDLAIQAHVARGAGLSLDGTWLMHINTQYVYAGGPLDLTQLFFLQDLSAQVAAMEPDIAPRLARMKAMLQAPLPPAIEPGSHCHQPYDCPFWDHCTKEKPVRWIYHLPGSAQTIERLSRQGVETIDAIPHDVKLTSVQRRVKDNVEWVGAGLYAALSSIRFPVHHLDFETFMPAIPKFPMTRPYQTIPTQWSNHIETEEGEVRHEAYLCRAPDDPREEFSVTLLESLGREGSICVYSDYERAVLQRLAEALPSLRADLTQAMARLWDLLTIVKDYYYHPAFAGSFSIKSVLPALVPDLSYEDLEIREGGTAARAYQQMVFEETDWVEKERLRDALLKYCERDTLAMLAVRKALAARAIEPRNA